MNIKFENCSPVENAIMNIWSNDDMLLTINRLRGATVYAFEIEAYEDAEIIADCGLIACDRAIRELKL